MPQFLVDPKITTRVSGRPTRLAKSAKGSSLSDKQDETLMLLRLDRALLELFAVRGRNITAYSTAKAKYGLS